MAALREVFGLSEQELADRWPPSAADWRAAFQISLPELSAYAQQSGWLAGQTFNDVIWEYPPFLLCERPQKWQVIAWAERGQIHSVGEMEDLESAARQLLRLYHPWLEG